MKIGRATLKDSLAVSYKSKHTYHMLQESHALVFTKGAENINPHKHLHPDVRAALFTIANVWKQPTRHSVGVWRNKLGHPDSKIFRGKKK